MGSATAAALAEAGLPGYECDNWYGIAVTANTPKPVVDKLVKSLQAGMANADFQKRMAALGATVLTSEANPEALTKKVEQQVPQWAELFKAAGLQPQ